MSFVANRSFAFGLFWLATFLLPLSLAQAFPDAVKFSIPVSVSAGEQVVTPNGRYILLLSLNSTTVSLIDTSIQAECAIFTLSATPTAAVASDDSSRFFIATAAEDSLFEIDLNPEDGSLVASQVEGLSTGVGFTAAALAGDLLYLLSESNTDVHVFDIGLLQASDLGTNPFPLSFSAERLFFDNITADLLILGLDGTLSRFSNSTFDQLGTLNLGALSDAASVSFADLTTGIDTISGNPFAFASNGIEAGELHVASLTGETPPNAFDADPTTSGTNPILIGDRPVSVLFTDVSDPEDSSLETDQYLYIGNNGDNQLQILQASELFDSDSDAVPTIATLDLAGPPAAKGISGADSYVYVSLSGANLLSVVTDNPQITISTAPPASVSSGAFNFGFVVDENANYEVRRNAANTSEAITPEGGDLLASGSALANQEVLLSLDADDFEEGDNLIHVFATASNRSGRVGIKINAQLPPAAAKGFKLSFGDQKIFVSFRSIEGNIDFYRIEFGNSKNNLTGTPLLESPIEVEHPGNANKTLKETLTPLVNGEQVFVRIVAVSNDGLDGTPTATLAETPEETIGILEFSGELGGCGYVKGSGATTFWLTLWAGLAILFGLRKRCLSLLILTFIVFSMTGNIASAQESLTKESQKKYSRPPILVGFRASWWFPKSAATEMFFGGEPNEIFSLRLGLPLRIPSGFIEPTVEIGFLVESAPLIGVDSGRTSGENSDLLLLPFRGSVTYVLDPYADWLVTPIVEAGYNLTYFDLDEIDQQVNGWRHSLAFRAGARVHLDRFSGNPDGYHDFLSLRGAFFGINGGYEIPLSGGGFKTEGFLISPEIGIAF